MNPLWVLVVLISITMTIKALDGFEKSQLSYGYIYKITNLVNKKVYIGQTRQNPKKRWTQHKSAAKTGEDHPLYNAMRYHGINKFDFTVVEKFPVEILDQQESKLIKLYKSNIREYGNKYGYNLTAGGLGMTLIVIDKSILEDLNIQGYSRKQICEELRISKQALYTRFYQLW